MESLWSNGEVLEVMEEEKEAAQRTLRETMGEWECM